MKLDDNNIKNTRYCIVIACSSNLTGYLNNSHVAENNMPQKLRIDYKQLLDYVVGDRKLIKALMVSQQDISINRSQEALQANQKFLLSLRKFGWDPLKVLFNSQSKEMTDIIHTIWREVYQKLHNENDDLLLDPSEVDIVFITGSQLWGDMINTFFTAGFNVEIAYPKKSTSKILYNNFAFFDLTEFIIYSNNCIENRAIQELEANKESQWK